MNFFDHRATIISCLTCIIFRLVQLPVIFLEFTEFSSIKCSNPISMSDNFYPRPLSQKNDPRIRERQEKKLFRDTIVCSFDRQRSDLPISFLLPVHFRMIREGISQNRFPRINTGAASRITYPRFSGTVPLQTRHLLAADQVKISTGGLYIHHRERHCRQQKISLIYLQGIMGFLRPFAGILRCMTHGNQMSVEFGQNSNNPDFKEVGIGVSSDGYNYYIVTVWK